MKILLPIIFSALFTYNSFSSFGQEMLFYQQYQRSEIPLTQITIFDHIKEERKEIIFGKKNRVKEAVNYLMEDNTIESKFVYTWDEHKIIKAEFISSYHNETEAFIESDSGLLYQIEFKPGFSKYRKVTPGKITINKVVYLTDEHFNILAIEQFDSVGQRWVTEINAYGVGTRLTGYKNETMLETQVLPFPKEGKEENVIELSKDVTSKKVTEHDEFGRILRLISYFRTTSSGSDYLKMIDRTWTYR